MKLPLRFCSTRRQMQLSGRQQDKAQAFGMGFLSIWLLCSGFFVIRSALPPWLVWLPWISPFWYAINAREFTVQCGATSCWQRDRLFSSFCSVPPASTQLFLSSRFRSCVAVTNNEFNSAKYAAPVPNDPEGRNQGQVLMDSYALVYSRTLQWLSVVFLAAMWLLVAFVLSPMALQHFRFDTTPGTVRRPLSASDREAIQALLVTTAPTAASGAGTETASAASSGKVSTGQQPEGAADRKVASAGALEAAGGVGTALLLPVPTLPAPAQSTSAAGLTGATAAEEQRGDIIRDAAAQSEMKRWAADVGTPSLPASGLGGPVAVEAPSAAASESGDSRIRTGRSGLTGDVGAIGIAGMVGTGCGAVRLEPPSRPDYPHAGAQATAMSHVGVVTAAEAQPEPPLADGPSAASVHVLSDPASIAAADPLPVSTTAAKTAPTHPAASAGNAADAAPPDSTDGVPAGKQLTREQAVAAELAATGRITPAVDFPRVALAFKDITYSVRTRSGEDKPLLRGCSGYALPYTLTALMGASGAGKTTLLDGQCCMPS